MRRERGSVDKREKVIGHLGILRTWCAVNPKYSMALSVNDCDKAVGWLDDAIEMMKAQEPVKPIENAGFYYCGACRYAFTSARQKYCTDCGRAVKWE